MPGRAEQAARSTMREKPGAVSGAPRSETNTNGTLRSRVDACGAPCYQKLEWSERQFLQASPARWNCFIPQCDFKTLSVDPGNFRAQLYDPALARRLHRAESLFGL
jgi:hypothetical protein